MPRKPKTPEQIAAAALEKRRIAKATRMRVRRAYKAEYGTFPKRSHKGVVSQDRIVRRSKAVPTKPKRGQKSKPVSKYQVDKFMPRALRANFQESKSAWRLSQPGFRDTDKRDILRRKREAKGETAAQAAKREKAEAREAKRLQRENEKEAMAKARREKRRERERREKEKAKARREKRREKERKEKEKEKAKERKAVRGRK